MRNFNTSAHCIQSEDYMVDISDKLKKIAELVFSRKYFVINCPRQYGKTTTLLCLKQLLKDEYIVASISFEGLGDKSFKNEENFCLSFLKLVRESLNLIDISDEYKKAWFNKDVIDFIELKLHIQKMCEDHKIVLMIDEVDKVSNNQVFLDFLSMLRSKYIARKSGDDYTFHSVILAGVHDIKNIKFKIIKEGKYSPLATEEKLYNSPWNIAAKFNIDMSFSPTDIESMLKDYLSENEVPMDIKAISQQIYYYTSGYPFLVSSICKIIDEELDKFWSENNVSVAVKIFLSEKTTLSDDIIKNLESYKDLHDFLYSVLIAGERRVFNILNPIVDLGHMFGYIKKENESDMSIISNKIFEVIIANYFVEKDSNASLVERKTEGGLYQEIVKNNSFNMELCLSKYAEYYAEIYNKEDEPFLEKHGRLLFVSYLRPLLNKKGFYHFESQFLDKRRMDIVVDYGQEQFIIELKIWRGEIKKEKAYGQLLGYMNSRGSDKGYLLIFDFRKNKKKEQITEWIQIEDKKIFCVTV